MYPCHQCKDLIIRIKKPLALLDPDECANLETERFKRTKLATETLLKSHHDLEKKYEEAQANIKLLTSQVRDLQQKNDLNVSSSLVSNVAGENMNNMDRVCGLFKDALTDITNQNENNLLALKLEAESNASNIIKAIEKLEKSLTTTPSIQSKQATRNERIFSENQKGKSTTSRTNAIVAPSISYAQALSQFPTPAAAIRTIQVNAANDEELKRITNQIKCDDSLSELPIKSIKAMTNGFFLVKCLDSKTADEVTKKLTTKYREAVTIKTTTEKNHA